MLASAAPAASNQLGSKRVYRMIVSGDYSALKNAWEKSNSLGGRVRGPAGAARHHLDAWRDLASPFPGLGRKLFDLSFESPTGGPTAGEPSPAAAGDRRTQA